MLFSQSSHHALTCFSPTPQAVLYTSQGRLWLLCKSIYRPVGVICYSPIRRPPTSGNQTFSSAERSYLRTHNARNSPQMHSCGIASHVADNACFHACSKYNMLHSTPETSKAQRKNTERRLNFRQLALKRMTAFLFQ